ncbi:hypothetical protein M0R45_026193 [Rubus argutus]|uniref:Uncharacterized protein n=1 Tax=Rubus argutus TaxID=59490 RepID=A0AAW1WZD0_RUBAR
MATAGYPLWILSSTDSNAYHPETLNYLEYLRMSQRGGVPPYFQSEASRHSATIRVNPITIVQTLMDVDQWLHIFCSLVTMLRSWRSCPLEKKRATRRERKLCQRSSCYQLLKFQLVKPSSSGILTNNWTEAGSL